MNDLPFEEADPQGIGHWAKKEQGKQDQPGQQEDQCWNDVGMAAFVAHGLEGCVRVDTRTQPFWFRSSPR